MKVKTTFLGSDKSGHDSEIQMFWNSNNEIFIEISDGNSPAQFIALDKSTAIKFSKVLRTEISKIED